MISGADFDHVAVAAGSRDLLEQRYVHHLGGSPGAEGPSPGFVWAQVLYAGGMRLEMLEPYRAEENDFLLRFLERNGPGPHHLTFKVPDFVSALAAAHSAGYSPVAVNDSDPNWKEAFLHPKEAAGVVVQLAESHEPEPASDTGTRGTRLLHVGLVLPDLEPGLRLFEDLLGGRRGAEGTGPGYDWVDLGWGGPGWLRLLVPQRPGPLREWLGARPGRVHHLAFSLEDPGGQPGASAREGWWLVEPAENQGTRLVLFPNPAPASTAVPL